MRLVHLFRQTPAVAAMRRHGGTVGQYAGVSSTWMRKASRTLTSGPAFEPDSWDSSIEERLAVYSKYKINKLTLDRLVKFGKHPDRKEALRMSCMFIHNEGPVRLAHLIQEMRGLPMLIRQHSLVQRVYKWYCESFVDLTSLPLYRVKDDVEQYTTEMTQMIEAILQRHAPTVMTVAQGVRQLQEDGALEGREDVLNAYLDRFLMARIGIRFVFNQHLALFHRDPGDTSNASVRWVGSIDEDCKVDDIAEHAADTATFLCNDLYHAAPPFKISTHVAPGREGVPFAYVPSHLYHMLFELTKNSFRAVVEHHGPEASHPTVDICIVHGNEDVTIKISDQGGGIPRRNLRSLFSYFYSTAPTPAIAEDTGLTDMNHAPLAGLGYGLPVSRLYARYFGGDLDLQSMDGYGTDAYIYLRSVATAALEVLPTYCEDELEYRQGNARNWMEDALSR